MILIHFIQPPINQSLAHTHLPERVVRKRDANLRDGHLPAGHAGQCAHLTGPPDAGERVTRAGVRVVDGDLRGGGGRKSKRAGKCVCRESGQRGIETEEGKGGADG